MKPLARSPAKIPAAAKVLNVIGETEQRLSGITRRFRVNESDVHEQV